MANSLVGINLSKLQKKEILEKILKYLKKPQDFFHIVSLNPENIIAAHRDRLFKEVLNNAQIALIDGVGVSLAARFMRVEAGERVSGVDMMLALLKEADKRRLTVVLIGGKEKIAKRVVECQKPNFPKANFIALEGIKDIKNPLPAEEKKIFTIVADVKPHFLFAAFGSPRQELWLYKNRHKFKSVICMGVGGAFDFLSGSIPRAPRLVRQIGLEWLFRLIIQPWRIGRQARLIIFILLVLKQKLLK